MVSFIAVVIAGSLLNPIVVIIGVVVGLLLGVAIKPLRNRILYVFIFSSILAVSLAYIYASIASPFNYRFDSSLNFDPYYNPWDGIRTPILDKGLLRGIHEPVFL